MQVGHARCPTCRADPVARMQAGGRNPGFSGVILDCAPQAPLHPGYAGYAGCNTGKSFICKDGPVYTLAQLQELPAKY